MKKIIKIVCALIAVLTALSLFAACRDPKKTTSPQQTRAAQTAAKTEASGSDLDEWGREIVPSAIPEGKKFDGETINFVVDTSSGRLSELSVESLNGDLINDAVYNRNLKVEADLGVTLNFITFAGTANREFATNVSRVVLSGTGDYDIACGYGYFLTAVVRNWCYANLKDVELNSSLDLSKPWWNQMYVSEATFADQIYTVTGDLAITSVSSACCIFFNKRLADEHLSAWGGTAGLYKLVEDGDWTIGKFAEICKDVYNDADGDGVRSDGDFYAFGSIWSGPLPSDAFQFGMDARITRKDENGVPVLEYNNARSADVVSKIYHFNADSAGVIFKPGSAPTGWYNSGEGRSILRNKFINGSLIFYSYDLSTSTEFADMTDDFGLLPMPKYDKEQTNYYTSQCDDYSAFALAADLLDDRSDKCDAVGTTFEKLAEESYRTVAPNYFETVMKYRYLRTDADNQKDIKMYDIIREGNNFNFGLIYSSMLDDVSFAYRHIIGRDGSENATSYWQAKEATIASKFNALLNDFESD